MPDDTSRAAPRDIVLRDVAESDLPIFFEHQRDPDATRMAAFPARDQEAFTAHWTKIRADKSVVIRTILFRGAVAGNVGCYQRSGITLLGYWIGKEFWGKGIATQALLKFLDLLRTRPVCAYVAKSNTASIRVLEKCGFECCPGADSSGGQDDDVEEHLMRRNH